MDSKPNPLERDPVLIFQEEDEQAKEPGDVAISITAMKTKRDTDKKAQINAVLQQTNYEHVMEAFVQSASRDSLLLRIASDVRDDLDAFTFDDIDDVLSNPYYAREYRKGDIVVWTYGKHEAVTDGIFTDPTWFMGAGIACLLLAITFFASIITTIIFNLFLDGNHTCSEYWVCWATSHIVMISFIGIMVSGLIVHCIFKMGYKRVLDTRAVHSFPVIQYRTTDV